MAQIWPACSIPVMTPAQLWVDAPVPCSNKIFGPLSPIHWLCHAKGDAQLTRDADLWGHHDGMVWRVIGLNALGHCQKYLARWRGEG